MERLIGAHMLTSDGLGQAIVNGKEIGCTAVQIFTSSPRMWQAKELSYEKIQNFDIAKKETGINSVVSHGTYLINLCSENEETRLKSINNIIEELVRCHKLGIHYLVLHMGADMGQGEKVGLDMIAENTQKILDAGPKDVCICMETTAGQGTNLNYKFEQLAYILEKCHGNDRLMVCIDTCHIFAAGYDISTPEGYQKTFDEFENLVGFDRLKVVHINDSKKPLGSRVDRHAEIGDGFIGKEFFSLLVNDPRFYKIPLILETPDPANYKINIELIRSFIKS